MLTREQLQENQYFLNGPYHRKWLELPEFHPSRLIYNLVLKLMPPDISDFMCLDFGGGDGALATQLRRRRAKVVIADPSELALNFAKKGDAGLNVVQAKTMLPFPMGVFDMITLVETLEHINDTDESKALSEAFRVLKPGGRMIITVPSDNKRVNEKHYRHYNAASLKEAISGAGFDIIKMFPYRDPTKQLARKGIIGRTIRGVFFATDYLARSLNGGIGLVQCDPNISDGYIMETVKN